MDLELPFKEWLAEVMPIRPQNNALLDSERGLEIAKLCIEIEREAFNWRRSDVDTFWIDIQMFVYYKLSDEEIRFICKQQPGIENHAKYAEERKAYAEMMRGFEKLKALALGMTVNEMYMQKHLDKK
ncbi:hypothetical protein [Streptococcus marmotae]|uniref:hypothetical protein n=1 Tax=Streptococcus marmotae TaxID=1825069 RepID=UPI00082EA57C|nr:hypothetical protein [Streptococcus marmotae]QBX16884.1 hypothetical protein Javan291_0008 [Streptococcus phage Javan291]